MSWLEPIAAHLVTGLRLVAVPLLVWAIVASQHPVAFALFVLAALSDLVDGSVARWLGTASETGRWFDHLADIVLLLSGYGALVSVGIVPYWVPAAIAAAFAYYVVDSLRRSTAGSLIGSRIGHASGVLNYAILGAFLLDSALGGGRIPDGLLRVALASVPVYSAAAIIGRMAGRSG